ncbi:MAG: MBL fold metallo-hydrolase [Thermodesulfobacterium geofontis]|uniref:MBL fold metallo-hydrolase n=1 Tax=Thermodesulfobacterium geofontis TaxID=1295609 RepID=A0A2N7PQ73_9BACT|nr:MAG: MBL fold metallo-hydrolase [Thermodesulfobacterium geofontis]
MKITVLIENSVGVLIPTGLCGEHGLSLWIEHEGYNILFDTGQTGRVVNNAIRLGIDLKRADAIILSHGHYDHTGGLKAVLEFIGKSIDIYAHEDIFSLHYTSLGNRFIGIPFRKEELEGLGANFKWIKEPREIFPNIWLSGEVPRRTSFEKIDERLCLKKNDKTLPDPLLDDMSLFIKTDQGLVIILGCAHSGIVNIIEHAKEVTGIDKIYAIIGGTHLEPASSKQLEETLVYLARLNFSMLSANHCTGLRVASKLKEIFGNKFRFGTTGETIIL